MIMKRNYIKPETLLALVAGKPVMADPSLGIASGRFKDGDEQLSKKYLASDEEEDVDFIHFVPWKDYE